MLVLSPDFLLRGQFGLLGTRLAVAWA